MPKFDKQSIFEPSHGIFSFSAAACIHPTSSLYCVVQLPQDWPSLAAEHPDMDIRVLESAYGHLDWAVSNRSWMKLTSSQTGQLYDDIELSTCNMIQINT